MLALVSLVVAVAATPAGAATSEKRPSKTACKKVRPSKLTFKRAVGRTVGTLRWRTAKRSGRARAARSAASYRVLRNRSTVGQTKKRKMRVRVSLDRTYRFVVVPIDKRGKRIRCGASKRVRVAYRPPGAPRHVAVNGGDARLQLSWKPGRRGDTRLAGYRVLRDGKVVGQRADTVWELAASPNRPYSFTVVGVDKRGRTSRPSRPVTAVAGHAAPSAPTGLQAIPTSESSIGLTWQPSTVTSGRVVGYRVLRDGAVVRQLEGTSFVLDNLAPSTDYEIAVVAIDDYGYASAPATVRARTHDPEPTSGHAHAYLLATTDQSFADFRAHYRQIGVIYPTYYDCTGAALLKGQDDPLVTQWAQARKVKVLPRINCQRSAVVERILTDPATREAWLNRLVQLVRNVGYDGLSVDFEAGPAEARDAMTSFIRELASRLHAEGRLLSMALSAKVTDIPGHPRSGIFDYPKLSEIVDYPFVMAWGLHWSTSEPGPQDDINWVRDVAAYVSTLPQRHKFIFGTNLYALDWPNGGGPGNTATAYEYQDIVPFLPQLGAQIALDPETDNYRATYTDAAGTPREVWYPDAVTTARRVRIAKDVGLGGVGFWRLGREDQRVWDDPLLAPGAQW